MIVDDGYNIGRDWLVQKATAGSHWNSMWWRADVVWNVNDLLKPGKEGEHPSFVLSMTFKLVRIKPAVRH